RSESCSCARCGTHARRPRRCNTSWLPSPVGYCPRERIRTAPKPPILALIRVRSGEGAKTNSSDPRIGPEITVLDRLADEDREKRSAGTGCIFTVTRSMKSAKFVLLGTGTLCAAVAVATGTAQRLPSDALRPVSAHASQTQSPAQTSKPA